MSSVSGAAASGRELLAHGDALGRAYEALAAATVDEARRAALSRVAGRLAASVVRPLGAALGDIANGAAQPGTEAELGVALHDLACQATRLRVGVGGPPALLEASAALQDLACQLVAEDDERLAARRGEFVSLQEQLAPSIQSAPDGPYLVTNVARMTDWLGVSLEPLPQAALCRCGASQLKPWCDGSHSVIGFHAAKAPDRVPDRLDTYQGQHLTVTDNRGICAHSGFCTDRAPTAGPGRHRAVRRAVGRSRRRNRPRGARLPVRSTLATRSTGATRPVSPTRIASRRSRSQKTARIV